MRHLKYIFLLLILCSAARAGTLTQGLIDVYQSRGDLEPALVLVVLAAQVNTEMYADFCGKFGLPLAETHRRILDSLQSTAGLTQPAVQRTIEILEGQGLARNAKFFWILNAVSADLTRAGAELLANMTEVEAVGLDDDLVLYEGVAPVIGSEPGQDPFAATGIREVWAYGMRGEGRIVCVLGEAFRNNHPALASSSRSQVATRNETFFDAASPRTMQYCGDFSNRALSAACGVNSATGDTLGAAPAAEWISADLFVCGRSRFSRLIASLQWAVDPDGNSASFGDAPDAILNFWGTASVCDYAIPAAAFRVFEQVESVGPVLVFAVPNDEAQIASVGTVESREKSLAIGNADLAGATPVAHESSAQGPSLCDSRHVKPDMLAPGTRIRVASPDAASGYALTTATAVSAGFVGGVVALLRQAAPNLSADEIKRVLRLSATDLGTPGADNLNGAGLLNARNALEMARNSGRTGIVQGVVRYGGEEIPGARVVLSGEYGDVYATANALGVFIFDNVAVGREYSLRVARFGYEDFELTERISVTPGQRLELIIRLSRGIADDAESDQGWSLGVRGDKATGGIWSRDVPVPSQTGGVYVQPVKAYSGSRCFVTGNAGSPSAEAGSADVDGGPTTLRSPVFSLLEIEHPELEFAYWYSNDKGTSKGGDFFRAQISNDGGKNWVNLINTAASTEGWQLVTLEIEKFVDPSHNMQLQFIVEDNAPASLVEAAVDKILITGKPLAPEPPSDLMLDVQFDYVVLKWSHSPGAAGYRVYLSGDPNHVIAPEFLYNTTSDTTLTVPMSDIPYEQFFFQVTAVR